MEGSQPEVSPRAQSVGQSVASSELSGASTASQGEELSQRQLLFSLCHPVDNSRRLCRHCSVSFASTSGSSTLLHHFQSDHKALWASVSQGFAKPRQRGQPTLHQVLDSKALADGFQDVVDSFIAHPALPLSLADCPLFRRILKYPQGVTSRTIRHAIKDKDAQVLKQLRVLLQSKVVGLQIDGGKTVSHRKVLGVGFTLQGTFYCWAVLECGQGAVWNEQFYCNVLRDVIVEIESYGAFVASVTADNEASLSAGIALLQQDMPHLIHNRCFCHTCELLISDLQKDGDPGPAIPMLQSVANSCREIVTFITNNKYVNNALERVQGTPYLVLKKISNTRKWSSSFLVCSRMLKLYSFIDDLENHICVGPSIPVPPPSQYLVAKREWVDVKGRLLPPRLHLEAVVNFLYWVYVAEQVLQRDVSSIIHAAALFETICESLGQVGGPAGRRPLPAMIQANMDATRVAEACMTRREALKRSNVYMLALFLWPKASVNTDNHASALRELKAFVTKSWAKWQEKPECVELHADARVLDRLDAAEMNQVLESFVLAATRELTLYCSNHNEIKFARDRFLSVCEVAIVDQQGSLGSTKRGRSSKNFSSSLVDFWLAVAPFVPHLFVVVKLLLATCSSEAAVERMFSKEGFIHDKTRNRLQHAFTEALVRCCINSKSLNGTFAELISELLTDDEDVDE